MKSTLQHCCDKTNGQQNGLKSRMLFCQLYKIMAKIFTLVGFRGVIAPWIRPCPEFMIGRTFSFSHCISTLFIWCCRFFGWWTRVLWGRGGTRLASTRSKKQVWRSHVRNWGFSEANVLYGGKYLWHCWDFSAPPRTHSAVPQWFGAAIITRCRVIAPPLHPSRYALVMGTPCDIGFYWKAEQLCLRAPKSLIWHCSERVAAAYIARTFLSFVAT